MSGNDNDIDLLCFDVLGIVWESTEPVGRCRNGSVRGRLEKPLRNARSDSHLPAKSSTLVKIAVSIHSMVFVLYVPLLTCILLLSLVSRPGQLLEGGNQQKMLLPFWIGNARPLM